MHISSITSTNGTIAGSNYSNDYNPKYSGDALIDGVIINKDIMLYAVIDGSRSPYDWKVGDMPTEAWAAYRFKSLLLTAAEQLKFKSNLIAEELLEYARVHYFKECQTMREAHPQWKHVSERIWNPACAFVIVLINKSNGSYSYVQGG